jgi:hypothetical protein
MDQKMGTFWKTGGAVLTLASALALLGTGGVAQADTLCIQNNAAFGNGPIVTVDCTTHTFVNSFIPDNAKIGSNNGRGVEVLGNFVYYTELGGGGFGATDAIHVAPFNNGAGGLTSRRSPTRPRAWASSIWPRTTPGLVDRYLHR